MDETEARQRGRAFAAKCDLSRIRDDLSVYLTKVNAKVKQEPLGAGDSGYTVTKPNGGHVITVNSLESEQRQRFTICHEIGHIVLDLSSSHEEVPAGAYAKREPNEVLCDLFAAELLMPQELWRSAIPDQAPSLHVIEELASQFRASFPATASRFALLSPTPCAFVTMERGRVAYSIRSTALRNLGARITAKSPIPVGSISQRLRAKGVDGEADGIVAQDIWFEQWERGFDAHELAHHYSYRDTTVCLLWCADDELPEFEVDRFGTRVQDDCGLKELTGELPWPSKSRRR